jgi:hypothetical protein
VRHAATSWAGFTRWDVRVVWRDSTGRLCFGEWVKWPDGDDIVAALRSAGRRQGGLEFIRRARPT